MKDLDEKDVLLRTIIPYFRRLGYTIIRRGQSFGVGARRLRADLVVYIDDNTPFAVVEVKSGHISLGEPNNPYHPVVQQAFQYALVAETRYFVVTNGHEFFWYQVDYGTGVPQAIDPVSNLASKQQNFALFHTIDEINQVIHSMIEIFERDNTQPRMDARAEVMKLLQAKANDEQCIQRGAASEFYIGIHETDNETARRIEQLYQSWTEDERSTFSASPSQIVLAASSLQSYSLLQSDKKHVKPAFDKLLEGMFRRDLGQYITPYPILEFLVDLLKPLPGEYVLDPFCGTAGFLTQVLTTWNARDARAIVYKF